MTKGGNDGFKKLRLTSFWDCGMGCTDYGNYFEGNQTCWDAICRKWNKIFCCITEVSPANFGYDEWKLEGNEAIEY